MPHVRIRIVILASAALICGLSTAVSGQDAFVAGADVPRSHVDRSDTCCRRDARRLSTLHLPSLTAASASVRTGRDSLDVPDPWLGQDKFRHAGVSFAATSFLFAAASTAMEPAPALRFAAAGALLAGVGKEAHDWRSGGIFSIRDITANAVGVAAAALFLRGVD